MAKLEITYVDLGQGDCTLVKFPDGKTMLVDCGTTQGGFSTDVQKAREDRDKLTLEKKKYIDQQRKAKTTKEKDDLDLEIKEASRKERNAQLEYGKAKNAQLKLDVESLLESVDKFVNASKKIDYLIMTHHDDDHYNKLVKLLDSGISFGEILYSGPIKKYSAISQNFKDVPPNINQYKSVTVNGVTAANQTLMEAATYAAPICETDKYQVYHDPANDVMVDILASNVQTDPSDLGKSMNLDNFHYAPSDINGRSVVVRVRFKLDIILILGDATLATEKFLVAKHGAALKAETMRVGHHGSDSSSSQALIDNVKPKLAIVSVATTNTYGLPRQNIIDRYINYFTVNHSPEVDEHLISSYTGKDTGYTEREIKQAIWPTWSLAENTIEYDGAG